MENREVAIQLSGVKKMYKLGQIGGGTLQGDLQSWWARIRGKEDPNSKIGTDQRSNGKTFMALNGLDLTVYKGEALGIIGGNGAGKSTLLKLLSRVTAPSAGEIDIYGRVASMLEVGTGFNGEMTGRENVYMNGAILGMTKAEIDAKMEDIIAFSEVREFIDTPVKRYSSGMYVKLAFAVAAHLDSEIMIMDEVLAVGDMKFQQKCLGKMGDAAGIEGRTVLYVSHNMNTVRQLCTRCIVLSQGRIIFDGDVEDAIAVYMQEEAKSFAAEVDLTRIGHSGNATDRVRMTKFTFCGQDGPRLHLGDCIRFKMDVTCAEQMEQLCLRCMVHYADGSPVGMGSTVNGAFSFQKGENSFSGVIDVSGLAPGTYYLRFALYRVNEFGTDELMDVVERTAFFKVEEDGAVNNLTWMHQWWGHTRIKDIQVEL